MWEINVVLDTDMIENYVPIAETIDFVDAQKSIEQAFTDSQMLLIGDPDGIESEQSIQISIVSNQKTLELMTITIWISKNQKNNLYNIFYTIKNILCIILACTVTNIIE